MTVDSRTMERSELEGKVLAELQRIADTLGLEGHQRLRKGDLINAILEKAATDGQGARSGPTEETSAEGPEASAADASENGQTAQAQATGSAGSVEAPARPSGTGTAERPAGTERPRRLSREERRRERDRRREREREEREEEISTAPSRTGVLDVLPEGYGFLRTTGYLPGPEDIYVSLSQIRRFGLRRGDQVVGKVRQPRDNEKYPALLQIETVAGVDPETARQRPEFDKLTPLFPDERFRLEHDPKGITERIIDLIAPVGKGQRGMVVSPPKAGKTTVLKQIAGGILQADPETHVIILLVDERPEEVTDWQRTVAAAEVVYSTFDKPADQHTQITELVLERAKRLVEQGQNVAILLDSITRLARAYNLSAPASGRILSGGVDSTALYPPKRFFGTARNLEEGGSLTIIASALVETGSRMDEVIFEEFKGTGNWEIRLDRNLSEKRIFPALNIEASGTRKEERLLSTEELALVWRLRRVLHALDPGAALELLIDKIRVTKSNDQFLREIAKAPVAD
ncbi:MAG: transcription termination factor Rho [Actinobacteria bacterium]|nr:MAG: transcription termination factor Rho [Actinomycetota bacterium]